MLCRSLFPGRGPSHALVADLAVPRRLAAGAECEPGKGLGPVPPASAVGEFQRFKNIYCNPDRVYQPDLVLDVKLYGRR